jgi:hypothetical protein
VLLEAFSEPDLWSHSRTVPTNCPHFGVSNGYAACRHGVEGHLGGGMSEHALRFITAVLEFRIIFPDL